MASKKHHHRARRGGGLFGRRHNPILPTASLSTLNDVLIAVAGAIAGGIGSSWIPNKLAPGSDIGWTGYAMNAAVAFGGAYLLAKASAKAALGWLLGGLAMTVGRVLDEKFGTNVVSFNVPGASAGTSGMGSFYAPGGFPLPAPAQGPYALLPAAPSSVAVMAKKGTGWAPQFRAPWPIAA